MRLDPSLPSHRAKFSSRAKSTCPPASPARGSSSLSSYRRGRRGGARRGAEARSRRQGDFPCVTGEEELVAGVEDEEAASWTGGGEEVAPMAGGGECDIPPRKIPYYRLNQSTLAIRRQ
jgi:hypothetical protein